MHVCFCCVRFSFFSVLSQEIGCEETSLKWPVWCWVGRKTLTQSMYVVVAMFNCMMCPWLQDVNKARVSVKQCKQSRSDTSVVPSRLAAPLPAVVRAARTLITDSGAKRLDRKPAAAGGKSRPQQAVWKWWLTWSPWLLLLMISDYRVTICLEKLEITRNCSTVRECHGVDQNSGNVMETSGENAVWKNCLLLTSCYPSVLPVKGHCSFHWLIVII